MKLLMIDEGPHGRLGVRLDNLVLDIVRAASNLGHEAGTPTSVLEMIRGGDASRDQVEAVIAAAEGQQTKLRESGALRPYDGLGLLAPIPDPPFILSVGMNYRDHLAEMNTAVPDTPSSFTKHPNTVIGPGAAIVLPAGHRDMVDFEGEITFVFGRECHNVTEDEAWGYVAGLTIANDVSARDWVAPVFTQETSMGAIHAWEDNLLGKQFPTFCPMGPVLTTADEIADPGNLSIETRLNGEVMQSSNANQLVFGIPELISFFSRRYRFSPGDIVTTGSPAGVGYGRDPKVFMHAGDIVEVELEGVGVLSNPISE